MNDEFWMDFLEALEKKVPYENWMIDWLSDRKSSNEDVVEGNYFVIISRDVELEELFKISLYACQYDRAPLKEEDEIVRRVDLEISEIVVGNENGIIEEITLEEGDERCKELFEKAWSMAHKISEATKKINLSARNYVLEMVKEGPYYVGS